MKGKANQLIALVVVLIIIIIAFFFVRRRWLNRDATIINVSDGGTVSAKCGTQTIKIVKAEYSMQKGSISKKYDVTKIVRDLLSKSNSFTVSDSVFNVKYEAPGRLTIKYRCVPSGGKARLVISHPDMEINYYKYKTHRLTGGPSGLEHPGSFECNRRKEVLDHVGRVIKCSARPLPGKETFVPLLGNPCCGSGPHETLWAWDRNADGTVVRVPFSQVSGSPLTTSAEAPSLRPQYQPANPVSRIGVTSDQMLWSDPHSDATCSHRNSVFELTHGQPGYLEQAAQDSTDGYAYQRRWTRAPDPLRDGPRGGPYHREVDGDLHYYNDPAVFGHNRHYGEKEGLTSSRRHERNPLTAAQTGLGSTFRDPRFEPETPYMAGGDAHYAHGGHAGGPTFGAYIDKEFAPGGTWSTRYVRGFGDGHTIHRRCFPWENQDLY